MGYACQTAPDVHLPKKFTRHYQGMILFNRLIRDYILMMSGFLVSHL